MTETLNQEDQTLSDLINRMVGSMMTPEFVETKIKDKLEKLVDESINNALRNYSPTAKLIEAKVAEALQVHDLDLPSYGVFVTATLKRLIDQNVNEIIAGKLSQQMEEILSLAPKEIKLSQITNEMLQAAKEDDPSNYGEDVITCIVSESSYGSTWIYLDESHQTDKNSCDYQFLVSKDTGLISTVWYKQQDVKYGRKGVQGRMYGLLDKLCAYQACGTKIIIDEDNVYTSFDYD